jgi:hypothetical protein
MDQVTTKVLFDSRETAQMLDISERTLFDQRKKGYIRATRIGGSVKFDIDEITDYRRRMKEVA